MILSTKKLTFKEILIVDLPDGSIPIDFKEGKDILTLWYWENAGALKPYTFCFFKKGSSGDDISNMKRICSVWFARAWWQVYEKD